MSFTWCIFFLKILLFSQICMKDNNQIYCSNSCKELFSLIFVWIWSLAILLFLLLNFDSVIYVLWMLIILDAGLLEVLALHCCLFVNCYSLSMCCLLIMLPLWETESDGLSYEMIPVISLFIRVCNCTWVVIFSRVFFCLSIYPIITEVSLYLATVSASLLSKASTKHLWTASTTSDCRYTLEFCHLTVYQLMQIS